MPSALLPVPHSQELSIPPLNLDNLFPDSYNSSGFDRQCSEDSDQDTTYLPSKSEPHLITQSELNNMVREFRMSKQNRRFFVSDFNLFDKSTLFS